MRFGREAAVVAVGVVLASVAVLIWLTDDAEPPGDVDGVVALLAFTFLVLAVAANYRRTETVTVEPAAEDPEEPAYVVGDDIRAMLKDPRGDDREELVAVLRRAAVDELSRQHGREEAREMVEEGSWTDDPRAAAALAEGGYSHLPLRFRLYDWLFEEDALERRAEAVVDELHRGGGG